MREHKYKVWDKVNKKYFRECNFLSFCTGGIRFMWIDGDKQMVTELTDGNYELLFYINHKDKTGKEIYLGDIVTIYSDSKWIVVWWNEFARWAIQDKEGNKQWTNTNAGGEADWERFEVIGNKFENEDLLK